MFDNRYYAFGTQFYGEITFIASVNTWNWGDLPF